MSTVLSFSDFTSVLCIIRKQKKKKYFRNNLALYTSFENRVVLGEALMMLYLFRCVFFNWVVVLSRCPVRGMGSSFYFKNAQWSNLQQQFWIWVFKKDLPWSFVHWYDIPAAVCIASAALQDWILVEWGFSPLFQSLIQLVLARVQSPL